MQKLKAADKAVMQKIKYVLCDLDDTVTYEGRVPAEAYQAIETLQKNNIPTIVVTGRPAGWCDMIARTWPVSAVVGENGAFYFMYDQAQKTMIREYQRDDATRKKDMALLMQKLEELKIKYPHIILSADQPYRVSDIAIDFCEDVPAWDESEVEALRAEMAEMGMTVKVSSIHLNAWFGDFSKLEMAQALLSKRMGLSSDEMLEQCIYAGDSPNDEPMFKHFPNSVGVANVEKYLPQMSSHPTWITEKSGGYGFAEMAYKLLGK